MQIPSYKIHNVLKVFTKQLKQNKISERMKSSDIKLSKEGKRQTIIRKVANEIVGKITQASINDVENNEISEKVEENISEYNKEVNEFVFNTIDDKNEKKTNKLLISDVNVFIRPLEQMVKKAINRKK